MELNTYLEERISEVSAKHDEVATAKLAFYTSLQRVLNKQATRADIGTMDAINDLL